MPPLSTAYPVLGSSCNPHRNNRPGLPVGACRIPCMDCMPSHESASSTLMQLSACKVTYLLSSWLIPRAVSGAPRRGRKRLVRVASCQITKTASSPPVMMYEPSPLKARHDNLCECQCKVTCAGSSVSTRYQTVKRPVFV